MAIRTALILERLDRNHRVLERREQWSRSFLKNFIELLYVQHAQIGTDSYANNGNIDKSQIYVDVQCGVDYRKYCLQLASPGGTGGLLLWPTGARPNMCTVPAQDIGIQIGLTDTPVIPLDNRMANRIPHGKRAPDISPILMEYMNTGDDTTVDNIYGSTWFAAGFVPAVAHRLTSVKLKLYKAGSPPDLTIAIRGSGETPNFDRRPGFTDLVTGTIPAASVSGSSPGAFVECTFATPIDVYQDRYYWIIARCPTGDASNHYHGRYAASQGSFYPRWSVDNSSLFGTRWFSNDGGASWSTYDGSCCLFEEYGQSYGEMEMGACEILPMVVSNPNAEFTIRRYFTNSCGSPLTVKEVGLQAAATWMNNGTFAIYQADAFLIARDVVSPGVAVAPGELLKVTYVPQITV